MSIQVNIDAEQINQMVSDAILNSVIGDKLKTEIEQQIGKLSATYDNPIKKVVEEEILRQIQIIVQRDFHATLEQMVKDRITSDLVEIMVDAVWNSANDKLRRR
jgi:hypothetical protein